MEPTDHFVKSAKMLGSIAVVVAALYLAKGVLVPLTLAVLLSFLLSPPCDWLERRGLGRVPAVLITAAMGFSLLGLAAWTALVQVTDLAPRLPEYEANVEARLHSANAYWASALSRLARASVAADGTLPQGDEAVPPLGTHEHPFSVLVLPSPATPMQLLSGTFGALAETLALSGVVVVLVVFFLVRREDLRDRFIRLTGRGELNLTTRMLEDAATRVSRYLSMLFVINATYGVAVGAGLYAIGVPNSILWAIMAATLRFIPYVGPWIAAAMPIGLSLAISMGWAVPVLAVALFVVLEVVSNNVMEPWLYGTKTGMSAVAVLLAAVFWTWLWGTAGLMLATPLTVCLLVIGKHVPQLSFLDTLLGNEPVFEPTKRVYQRLLAGDQEEAADLFEEELKSKPLAEVYDAVLIPALAMTEAHWRLGELDEGRHAFMLQGLDDMIHERGASRVPSQADEGIEGPREARILCLPARDQADGIAGRMLAQLLDAPGCLVQSVTTMPAAGELPDLVERFRADVVCISATPPAAVMHARHMCNQLRDRFPRLHVVVGLWNARFDLAKARARIGGGEQTHVVATLTEARDQVRLLVAPLLPPPPLA